MDTDRDLMKKPKLDPRDFQTLDVRQVKALERIADALEIVIDKKKKTLRMVDVDRSKVYKTHLGGKLRKKA